MSITNKDVIEAFIADFKWMHHVNHQPDVRCDFDGDPSVLAMILPVAGHPTLRFSYRFADSVVSSHADLFYCLIIAGHELAHWANAHTKHVDTDDLDSKAIEIWADLFGTRIVFTAVARCPNLRPIINRLRTPAFDAEGADALLPAYGEALRQVYERVFVPAGLTPTYPSPNERVQICGVGVTSFFYRHLGKMHQRMTVDALKKVILEPFADVPNLFPKDKDWEESADLAYRTIEIHIGLKQARPSITPGIRPEFNQLVGTNYLGHAENQVHREGLKDQVRAWGVDV